MPCRLCGSESLRDFDTEVNLHPRSQKTVDYPSLLIFPELRVCLRCGLTEGLISPIELKAIQDLDSSSPPKAGNR